MEILMQYGTPEQKERFLQPLVRGDLPEYWDWWEASGVDVASVTVGPFGRVPFSYESALHEIAELQRRVDALGGLVKVTKAADI